ncbi:MAG: hypothetical protein FWF53_10770 [Candidatus Azobacteroides sp.]|nr:hypothetical protein [Candidatus Azobacteroides sp.]
MKRVKNVTLILLLCAFFTAPLQSQVTIGALSEPQKGALLDLKESDVSNGGSNTTKGLMYPRVSLSDLNKLRPMLSESDANDPALQSSHTGLTVYNVNEATPFEKGLYTWDGAKWIRTGTITGAKNGLSLTAENDTVKLGGLLEENTTIDLDDNDLTIGRSDDGKSGRLRFKSVPDADTGNDTKIAQLAVDEGTGEVVAVRSSTGNTKPFNYVSYVITCASTQPEYIADFDTKIPANEYTVFIVGSKFTSTDPGNIGLKMKPGNGGITSTTGSFGPQNVYAFPNGTPATWRLCADFGVATTGNDLAGKWEIHCVIINNALVQQLNGGGPITYTMPGSNSGNNVPDMPAGL